MIPQPQNYETESRRSQNLQVFAEVSQNQDPSSPLKPFQNLTELM